MCMGGWLDIWKDRWMNEWLDGWVNGQMNGRMDGWTDRLVGNLLDEETSRCVDEWARKVGGSTRNRQVPKKPSH